MMQNRFYKTLENHRLHMYRKTITVSDEAFLWQIMSFYPSSWKNELQVGNGGPSEQEVTETAESVSESVENSSSQSVSVATDVVSKKRKGQPKDSKTQRVKPSIRTRIICRKWLERATEQNWKLWSSRLREIAARREFGTTTAGPVIPQVMTIAPLVQTVNHFAEFAPLGVVNTMDFTGDSEGE